jgi:hypothetical protein
MDLDESGVSAPKPISSLYIGLPKKFSLRANSVTGFKTVGVAVLIMLPKPVELLDKLIGEKEPTTTC